ncbi:glycosyl hydrolase family 5 [Micractinium conductrix]|uniref:Glycosyl hydrolase family 5 n=1 Tax=Micractinium conductrix TaxID=554055 RepID=A0A2P6VFC2_9CHLO|nr:glycosyl hydrolase family 5 [Micractinium conductrix]|eukprot:PSC72769.1 glycosyl hydrolase family 5 [Micractinium conductrix]
MSRAFAAVALLACLSVASARMLLQTGSVSDYTNTANTIALAPTLVGAGSTATSADECITKCLTDADCTYWSWCPTDATADCTLPGLNGAADTTVVKGACLMSYDGADGRHAVFTATGSAVLFQGGHWNPVNSVPPVVAGTVVNASDPASWIDPAGVPAECNGWFTGDQWSGDEIECSICSQLGNDGDYQLKCDLDTDIIGDDSVKCELEATGNEALTFNAVEISCTVDWTKVPQNQCNWADIDSKVPECAKEPVKRILATWRPDE